VREVRAHADHVDVGGKVLGLVVDAHGRPVFHRQMVDEIAAVAAALILAVERVDELSIPWSAARRRVSRPAGAPEHHHRALRPERSRIGRASGRRELPLMESTRQPSTSKAHTSFMVACGCPRERRVLFFSHGG
jgi:hypothetical protein